MTGNFLESKARWARRQVLEMGLKAGGGHIAPAFSCTDILVALYYGGVLRVNPQKRFWKNRDRLILSKGHACAALYAILADLGFFPVGELMTYCQDGSRLSGHPEGDIPGIEVFTGSLGHGLSLGVGIALAAKMDKKDYFTFAILGDGEMEEGANWEAAMFASRHKLGNLIAIVDRNKLQSIDPTESVLSLEPLEAKWKAFGWKVENIDGHDLSAMAELFRKLRVIDNVSPTAVIAHTTKGKGVSFIENKIEWHFRIPSTPEEIAQARKELG